MGQENGNAAPVIHNKKNPEPACPRCHYHPVRILEHTQKFVSGTLIKLFYCADCGIVLPVSVLAIPEPEEKTPAIVGATLMPTGMPAGGLKL